MHLVAEKSNAEHAPLAFLLDVRWESASPEAKSQSAEKASEDCLLVCNMIAPESGAQLYKALTSQRGMEPSSDLEALMTKAYRNARTAGLKTQILSIYASSEASKKTCKTAWPWNHSRKGAKALYEPRNGKS